MYRMNTWATIQCAHVSSDAPAHSLLTTQVMGHAKTVMVLLSGWLWLDSEVNAKQGCGVLVALAGMAGYSYFQSEAPQPASAGVLKLPGVVGDGKDEASPGEWEPLLPKGKGSATHLAGTANGKVAHPCDLV